MQDDWRRYLSEADLATIERGKWARTIGYGGGGNPQRSG
jgi:DUF917 family protein